MNGRFWLSYPRAQLGLALSGANHGRIDVLYQLQLFLDTQV